jgi:hypothetical protein
MYASHYHSDQTVAGIVNTKAGIVARRLDILKPEWTH